MLLERAIALRGDDPDSAQALADALAVMSLRPDAQGLKRLQDLMSANPLSAVAEKLVVAISCYGIGPIDCLWKRMRSGSLYSIPVSDDGISFRMAVLAQLLEDHRLASPSLMALAKAAVQQSGSDISDFPISLRVCDVASINAWKLMCWTKRLGWNASQEQFFPVGGTLLVRDLFTRPIIRRIQHILPAMLTHATLPLTIPGFDFPVHDSGPSDHSGLEVEHNP